VIWELIEFLTDRFYRFPKMFTSVGVTAGAAVVAALIVGVSILLTMLLQWRGQLWRWGW
jgi:hypothetical protein